jgi:uncharacterized protein YecE (DUF72 family)
MHISIDRDPIHVGIGGWNYEPWRGGHFYPPGLPVSRELAYAAQRLGSIEVNGTFYALQRPEIYARWAAEVPEGFVFALKAHRLATYRRSLWDGIEAAQRFIDSGIGALGSRLGPILWQLMPSKAFDPEELEPFLACLPESLDGRPLQHALEVRHPSFACSDYLALARAYGVATVFTDSPDYPGIADPTAPFCYARLMRADAAEPLGYPPAELDRWAAHARDWASGDLPDALPLVDAASTRALARAPRPVFVYFISGAKERNPAAAMGLIERLG